MELVTHSTEKEILNLFMYVLSNSTTALQFCQTFGGTAVEEKNTCFECQPIRIKSMYVDVLSDWTTITKAI